MATQAQSILRNGLTSPARAMMKTPVTRPILKRPTALPMSPSGIQQQRVASFSVLMSPSAAQTLKSPHVHFPRSPSQLVATFTAHSAGSYDRAPISVSPNPLAFPSWGERVYSPSLEGFKLSAPPKPFRSLVMAYQASPVITDFEDPRSPKTQPAADVNRTKASNAIRFAQLTSTQGPTQPNRDLGKSLSSYPRSPYPSAPVTPTEEDVEMETRGRQWPRKRDANDGIPSGPARARARAQSLEEHATRNRKGLTLGGRTNPVGALSFTPIPSPLAQSFVESAAPMPTSSLNRAHKPAPLALDSPGSDNLSQAFWQSVCVEAEPSADEPMVTALEYPESATEYDEMIDMELRSAAQPPLMFAGADGVLFSPGLPKPRAAIDRIRESLSMSMMSPGVKRNSFGIARKDITAPSPNDPFAAFPSFSVALQMGGMQGPIQYPPPVVQRG